MRDLQPHMAISFSGKVTTWGLPKMSFGKRIFIRIKAWPKIQMMVVKGFQEIWRLKLPLLSHDIRNTRLICFEEFAASGQDTLTSVARYHCVTFQGFWGSVWMPTPKGSPKYHSERGRESESERVIVLQFCKLELRSMWNWDASSVTCRFFIELWSGWMFSQIDIWKNLAAKITTFQPWEECCRIFLLFSCWRWMK